VKQLFYIIIIIFIFSPNFCFSQNQDAEPKKIEKKVIKKVITLSNEKLKEIQQALIKEGFFAGYPDGKWDAQFIRGLKRYQKAKGLKVTGKPDKETLDKLGIKIE